MEAVFIALLVVAYNNLLNLWSRFHHRLYVPLNLALAAILLASATGPLGLGRAGLGLAPGQGAPALVGAGLGLLLAAPLLVAALSRRGARAVADGRIAGTPTREVAYRALVRVPLGTALTEELIFRGVLFALWLDQGPAGAAIWSSAAFALWHIVPSLHLLRANRLINGGPWQAKAALLGLATILAFAAGLGLSALRVLSGGIAAPFALHATLNSLGTMAAHLANVRSR